MSKPELVKLGDVPVGANIYFRVGPDVLYGSREAFSCTKRHGPDCVVVTSATTAYHRSRAATVVIDRLSDLEPRTWSRALATRVLAP